MAIRKEANGKYTLDLYIGENGRRNRMRQVFSTLKEAKDFEAEARKSKNFKKVMELRGQGTRTIGQMAEYYFSLPRFNKLAETTQKRYRELIGHFTDWCATNDIIYVQEFSREQGNGYINSIMERCYGKGQEHNLVAAKMLFIEEMDRDNSCVVKDPFPRHNFDVDETKPVSLSEDLLQKLRTQMDPLLRNIFDLFYYTACRSGELLNLKWDQVTESDIRFEKHLVDKSIKEKPKHWRTKTRYDRTIPMNNKCKLCIQYLRGINSDCKYVLPDQCRKNNWLRREFVKVKKKVVELYPDLKAILFPEDRGKNVTPKTYRSTAITHITKKTGDITIAQKLAGHRDIQTTRRSYLDDDALDTQKGVDVLDL